MQAAQVPVVPGMVPADQSDAGVAAAARAIGYPVLVKASAGGGGKGMRVVGEESSARESIQAARREAVAAFGDGTLYVERLIERPRHVEIQVFGDAHGGVVHLFERECSIQRRHQKVVEESPSPALTSAVRQAMGEAAVAAARASGYRNAGTIEFLLEGEGDAARFYFLEMNTRLQVEHPVTEAVTGVDLVRAQLTVAAGEALPWTQAELSQRGHAIECRVYAEDPGNGFLPQAGPLLLYREPQGPGVRVDSGVREGATVSVNYDPLLAKLTVLAESRDAAIARALAALRSFPVLGIRTNIPFLIRLLDHREVRAGRLHTGFIEQHLDELIAHRETPAEAVAAAAVTPDARLRKASADKMPFVEALRSPTRWIRGPQSASGDDSAAHHHPARHRRRASRDARGRWIGFGGGPADSDARRGRRSGPRWRPSASRLDRRHRRDAMGVPRRRRVRARGGARGPATPRDGTPGIAVGADARHRRAR